MSKLKLPHASGNSMSIAAPATNPASDLELKLPATIGTAGQVLRNSSTPGTLEFGGGIQEFDMWRVNSDFTASSADITANWERADTNFDKIGTGLTESSGVFTFPSNGKWLIGFSVYMWNTPEKDYLGGKILVSNNSGGSYDVRTEALTASSADTVASNAYTITCLDIVNASAMPMKFQTVAPSTSSFNGSTSEQRTGFWTMKVGDT